ncbi:unnamed protein product [Angiostrongylus costaricensis]|uniref:HDAC_interact domain-containing protein n=1 Tax=Angiostrongylus costaricensis TaxID=334426 RepID=A0A158PF21_ANGCS|nr:unnamed protein product [Angiostrongylus costaricensis]
MKREFLEVEDALSYLDQVKTQFADQPNVYTQFLDIMKDFKSQAYANENSLGAYVLFCDLPFLSIDTPGVITRVIMNEPATERLLEEKEVIDGGRMIQSDHRISEHTVEDAQNIPTPAALAPSPRANAPIVNPNRQDINEAIGYVNRIKARFANKPIVYKKFLDILHTYQRTVDKHSRSPPREKAVLDAVTSLFGEEPDLLEEFRHFLPGVYGLRSSSDVLWDNEQKEVEVSSESEETPTREEPSDSEREQRSMSKRKRRAKLAMDLTAGIRHSNAAIWKREVSMKDIVLSATVDDIMYFDKVLNDTWVSFPSWSSEDTTHVSSKKTQYEEFIYRTEDERFELDIIIDVNKYAIESLEVVRRRMERMTQSELDKFQLDERLGGSSPSLMLRAIKRIYGEHASKITEGIKRNPSITIPKVLDRMRDKEKEWREAQVAMNRSEEGLCEDVGPHIVLLYPEDRSLLHDASNLIIHYVKRQSNIHKEEKNKIKCILRRFVTEWFGVDDEEMSDGEENSDPLIHAIGPPRKRRKEDAPEDEPAKLIPTAHYRLVYGGNSLFLFFRVHQMICDRLGKLKIKHAEQIRNYEDELKVAAMQAQLYKIHGKHFGSHEQNASDTNNGLAIIKSPQRSPLSNYSDLLCEIKNLLDGNIDSNTFEDNVRLLFPIDGYLVATIDKLIAMVGRQLHFMATGSEGFETMRLYQRYRYDKPISVFSQSARKIRVEEEYSQSAESFFSCQNCFKIFLIYEEKPVVTIELVDTETEEEAAEVENSQPNDDSVAYVSSDDDSDQNEEVEEEQRRTGRTGVLKPNGLSSTSRLFMRRNARIRKPEIAGEFVVVGGIPNTGCSYSWEGIVRRNRFRGLCFMERMYYVRKSRAGEMFAEEHGVTWLTKGMQKIKSHHPVYTFLRYNKYMMRSIPQQSFRSGGRCS